MGGALVSLFLTERWARRGPRAFPYDFRHAVAGAPGVAVHDPRDPEAVVSWALDAITALVADAGLRIRRILPGHWADVAEPTLNEQDLLLLERAD